MYRHLLVPVDDTDLSVEVVGNAVALARPLGARITFFHAVADAAGSLRSDAEVLRLTARNEYEYAHLGKARELLTKAEAAARALGVPCESRHAVSDKPAQAIVEAARALLTVENSAQSRDSYGGTAPQRVREQVARWKEMFK